MPATAIRTEDTPRPITAEVSRAHAKLIGDAKKRWREWATAIAAGHTLAVEPTEILAVAATLGRRDPGADLARDAEVVRQVLHAETRAAALKEAASSETAAAGGREQVRSRIHELEQELRRLKASLHIDPRHYTAGQLRNEAARARAAHPDLFPAPATKTRRVK